MAGKMMSRAVEESRSRENVGIRLPPPASRLRLGGYVQQAVLLLASVVALFPLWFMVWTALRSQEDYFASPLGWPQSLHWDNFVHAFEENIGRWVVNSTIVTGGAVLLVTVISVPAAYTFVRLPFRGSDWLLRLFVFLMVIPPIVMLLPLFSLMNALGTGQSLRFRHHRLRGLDVSLLGLHDGPLHRDDPGRAL